MLEDCIDLLETVCSNMSVFQSAFHPLGFVVITLYRTSSTALRLHIWPKVRAVQQPAWMIHDHTFRFDSHVMVGELVNVLYEIKSNMERKYRVFDVDYQDGRSIMRPTTQVVALKEKMREAVVAGGYYSIGPGEIHETEVPPASVTATILLTENVQRTPPRVFGDVGVSEDIEYIRAPLEPAAVLALLTQIQSLLKAKQQ
jgi:hypothetical protein